MQCDGYAAYESFAQKRGLALAACWAHARREFHAAKDYDLAIPNERLQVRQRESLPTVVITDEYIPLPLFINGGFSGRVRQHVVPLR